MLIEKSNTTYRECRIPGLVMTKKGTLLGYYECRNSTSDWAQIDIKVIRSIDKGENWETVCLIKGNGNTLNNPVMIVEGETIHFLYCRNYKQLFYCKSMDDGNSFVDCKEITEVFEQNKRFYNVAAIGPGHGIVHDDTLLVPAWFAYNKVDEKAHHPSFIRTIYSKDSGKSWYLGELIGEDMLIDPSECALASTKEGKVLISIRNENPERNRAFAMSQNGYESWEQLHFEPNLIDPICQGSMDVVENAIYHINCDSTNQRKNLTIKISTDAFASIEKSILVDEEGGYSDMAVTKEEIYVLYERNIGEDGLYFEHKKNERNI